MIKTRAHSASKGSDASRSLRHEAQGALLLLLMIGLIGCSGPSSEELALLMAPRALEFPEEALSLPMDLEGACPSSRERTPRGGPCAG